MLQRYAEDDDLLRTVEAIKSNCGYFGGSCLVTAWLLFPPNQRQRSDYSPPIQANRVRFPAESFPDFRRRESCLTMPLVGGFSRGTPVSVSLAFQRYSILTSFHPNRLSKPRC
ncbi:hypothetical protein PR048_017877 [Dryococelus australis]|uniref:Uncharacterized protein n=1 Tax=Dryococelus australis TaxID=614101 RepID=A0ABQ9HAV5_9NEOP|nr:hypothetical protein PR048_017877 [Dryococelus australis]